MFNIYIEMSDGKFTDVKVIRYIARIEDAIIILKDYMEIDSTKSGIILMNNILNYSDIEICGFVKNEIGVKKWVDKSAKKIFGKKLKF